MVCSILAKWKIPLNSFCVEWFLSSQREWSSRQLKRCFWSFTWTRTRCLEGCRLVFLQMWFLTVRGQPCLLWVCVLTLYIYCKRISGSLLSANISSDAPLHVSILKVTFWAHPLEIWTLSLRCRMVVVSRTWSILLQIFMFSSIWEIPSKPRNRPRERLWATWWKVSVVKSNSPETHSRCPWVNTSFLFGCSVWTWAFLPTDWWLLQCFWRQWLFWQHMVFINKYITA